MLRVHFTAEDFARVRFAPRPSPVAELHAALTMLGAPHEELLFGRWRGRLLRALPGAAGPLADLVPGGSPPSFLDVLGETRERASPCSGRPGRSSYGRSWSACTRGGPPHRRGSGASTRGTPGPGGCWSGRSGRRTRRSWRRCGRWSRTCTGRSSPGTALAVAERGLGAALAERVPGSRLRDGVWEWPGATAVRREVRLGGRGLVLLPTFHWRGGPLVQDPPGRPVVLAAPAGRGLPLAAPDGAPPGEALAGSSAGPAPPSCTRCPTAPARRRTWPAASASATRRPRPTPRPSARRASSRRPARADRSTTNAPRWGRC